MTTLPPSLDPNHIDTLRTEVTDKLAQLYDLAETPDLRYRVFIAMMSSILWKELFADKTMYPLEAHILLGTTLEDIRDSMVRNLR